MRYILDQERLQNFSQNIYREWVLTNGIGGYAGASVTGAFNRTHQGYLIASFHPPVSRYVCFSKTNERIIQDNEIYDFSASQHYNRIISSGYQYLKSFEYDGTVCFTYQVKDCIIRKRISLVQGENTVGIAYEIQNTGNAATLYVTPLMNFREHSSNSTRDSLNFKVHKGANHFTLIPQTNPDIEICLSFSQGALIDRTEKYDEKIQLMTEVDNEVYGLETCFTPFDIAIPLAANTTSKFSIVCKASALPQTISSPTEDLSAFQMAEQQKAYVESLIASAGYEDPIAQSLVVAANNFISHRNSTGYKTILAGLPWFTDWGRDTMIAFTGVALTTKQFDTAREILLTFAKYEKQGLIPNMFPDNNQEPLYNTADASLWYFYAVYKYLEYTGTSEDYDFIRDNIYPSLKNIIEGYKNGTDFSIYMDSDYLIHAGSGLDQVTWMDVRVGDWVATPRHGKPVEINALWYNALCIMSELAAKFGEDNLYYQNLSAKVKASFSQKFWNPDTQCLFDVVDTESDPTIRPNQIYTVSLPFSLLSPQQEASIVDLVTKKLFVGVGLRSLDPDHKDYHPIYLGALQKRDEAYHQGTAWGFLLGGFITAYMKVHHHSASARENLLDMLEPAFGHIRAENCIGSMCEIFDGDAPHKGRGCYAQAWSVGELLRAYVEDIL